MNKFKLFVCYTYIVIVVMAKVSRMADGLKRRQTYEEAIDYIENAKDEIKYPDRTEKQVRNTLS